MAVLSRTAIFYFHMMNQKTFLILVLVTVTSALSAQDRIYKVNGLIEFAEVKHIADSGVVYMDQSGNLKTAPLSTVSAIKCAIGNVKPISGAIARRYRDDAYVFYPKRSGKLLQLHYHWADRVLAIGFEYFFGTNQHTSLSAGIGVGVGNSFMHDYLYDVQKTRSLFNAGWRRYPSLLRQFRFHYGVNVESSFNRVIYSETRSYNPEKADEFNVENIQVFRIGFGPEAGILGNVAPNILVGTSFSPQLCFTTSSTKNDYYIDNGQWNGSWINLQVSLSVSYLLK